MASLVICWEKDGQLHAVATKTKDANHVRGFTSDCFILCLLGSDINHLKFDHLAKDKYRHGILLLLLAEFVLLEGLLVGVL